MFTSPNRRHALKALAFASMFAAIPQARSQSLMKPTGKVILTVSGQIKATNQGDIAEFDMPMLEKLGVTSFTTKTPWYSDPVTFEGVPMARLLEHLGASGEKLVAQALNDYTTEIPLADFKTYNTILAIKRDGAYMPVRDKGPLFIVYPYDSDKELQHQRYYSRSAWQVARMTVK